MVKGCERERVGWDQKHTECFKSIGNYGMITDDGFIEFLY